VNGIGTDYCLNESQTQSLPEGMLSFITSRRTVIVIIIIIIIIIIISIIIIIIINLTDYSTANNSGLYLRHSMFKSTPGDWLS
jgi:hypothetical protein